MKPVLIKKSLLAASITSALLSHSALAETASPVPLAKQKIDSIEVITIKGAKRPKTLKEVPASVTVIGGEQLRQFKVEKLDDLSTSLPNVSISENAIQDTISIRGINSDLQAGGEQSVGIFVDGVYHGRGVQSRFSFLDVDSVEVLRGPQGALFGKNTIGGVLSINPAQPTEDFEANINIGYELEQEKRDISGHITGALNDSGSLTGRFAFNTSESKKGWVTNVANDETMPIGEKNAYRAIVNWQVNDQLKINVRLDQGDYLTDGSPYEIYHLAGPLAPLASQFGAEDNVDGKTNISNSGIAGVGFNGGDKAFLMDTNFSERVIKADYSLATGTITAIASQSSYDFIRSQDADFGPLPLIQFTDNEDFSQDSLEVRFVSKDNDNFEYLFGAYFQRTELVAEAVTDAFTAEGSPIAGLLPIQPQHDITSRVNGLDQKSDSWAIFGQTTFSLTDSVKLDLSARYSREEKEATQFASLHGGALTAGGGAKSGLPLDSDTEKFIWSMALLEVTEHSNPLSKDESLFSPAASISWQASENAHYYASVSKGFKGGGFNAVSMSPDPEQAVYENETAISTEFGGKLTLADGTVDLNFAVFNIGFDDMQTTVFTGGTTFIVRNAASATSRGLEADMKWLATDDLTLNASLGYLDFKFDDFKNAGCTAQQVLDSGLNAAQCSEAGLNDMSGKPNQDTPEWKITLGGQYQKTIGNYDITTVLNATYVDDYFGQPAADPITVQEPVTIVDAAISIQPVDGDWKVSLIGKNLTDENYFWYTNGVPLFTGSFFASYSAPSTVALEFSYTFGE